MYSHDLPHKCSLQQALLWITIGRVPEEDQEFEKFAFDHHFDAIGSPKLKEVRFE